MPRAMRKWTREQVLEVVRLLDSGMPPREVGEKFNTSKGAILGMRRRYLQATGAYKPMERETAPPEDNSESTHWRRKCLHCGVVKSLERPKFMCDPCKSKDVFSARL